MAKRQSINGAGLAHENPIPNASRIGNIVMSSVIGGTNPGTREAPDVGTAGDECLRDPEAAISKPPAARPMTSSR